MKLDFIYRISISLIIFFSFSLEARDFTFFIASDPHYGYEQWSDNEKLNKEAIEDMNQLPGTSYPDSSLSVQRPKGVVVTGDLTSSGGASQWSGYWAGTRWISGFDQDYEVNGNGLLKYPVYEGYGNHDVWHPKDSFFGKTDLAVLVGMYYRNQARSIPVNVSKEGLHYSWDWEGVHFVQLNIYPGGEGDSYNSLDFLKEDLKQRIGDSELPIILFHHYDFRWDPERWFKPEDKAAFYEVIKNYNIVAIFFGHTHGTNHYLWNNIPVFNVPTVKDHHHYFVIRIIDQKLLIHERIDHGWGQTWDLIFKN